MAADATQQNRFEEAIRNYIDIALQEGEAGRVLSNEVGALRNGRQGDERLWNPVAHQDFAEALKSLMSRDKLKFDIPDLFQKNAVHILGIRNLIEAVKEFTPPDDTAHKAAQRLETALNEAIKNVHRSRSAEKSHEGRAIRAVRVVSYGSVHSKCSAKGGLIVQEFGEWDISKKNYIGEAIIQIPSEWFLQNIAEANAYAGPGKPIAYNNEHPVDIEAIMQDGTTYRFNAWNKGPDNQFNKNSCFPYVKSLPEGKELIDLFSKDRNGITIADGALSEEKQHRTEELLKTILPALVEKFPPAVSLQKKRGGIGE